MHKNLDNISITFLSGSAGELDWVLPILDDLYNRGHKIHLCCLSQNVYKSIFENKLLRQYIQRSSSPVVVHKCYSFFSKFFDKYSYLFFRLTIKLNLRKLPLIKNIFLIVEYFLENIFFDRIPKELILHQKSKNLIFNEFPALRKPYNKWIKSLFPASIFFYIPHSPHFYTENLDIHFEENKDINFNCNSYLLLGHPLDFKELKNLYDFSEVEPIFLGHPKYSKHWLEEIKQSSVPKKNHSNNPNILVISRGVGSYLSPQQHKYLVDSTCHAIEKNFKKFNLFIKKHPREINSYWDEKVQKNKNITYTDSHILQAAASSDFVISFWSSGAMDCFAMDIPVIEFFDPNISSFQQVQLNEKDFTTIYRLLGCVIPASNIQELCLCIKDLKDLDFLIKNQHVHPRLQDLLERSQHWNEQFLQILHKNDLL